MNARLSRRLIVPRNAGVLAIGRAARKHKSNYPRGDLPVVTRIPAGAEARWVKVSWRGHVNNRAG
jgi:hypothetical protein